METEKEKNVTGEAGGGAECRPGELPEIQDKKSLYRFLFEQAQDAILLLELQGETPPVIREANAAALRTSGYALAELEGKPISMLDAEEDPSLLIAERLRKLRCADGSIFEARHRRKDGAVFTVEVAVRQIAVGGKVFVLDISRDVTERVRGEAALRESETRYRRLFESAQDGILLLDAETGMITDANPFILELLGFSCDQILHKKIWEIGAFKDTFANKEKFAELQSQGYVRYADLPLVTANGRKLTVEFVSNVYMAGGSKVIQCNIRDNTQRRKAEDGQKKLQGQLVQSQKMETIGRLAGGVAHDFNNILTAIKGYSALVTKTIRPEDPALEDMREIMNAADRASTLTSQLLAFSRKQIMSTAVVDLNKTLGDMGKMLQRVIGEDTPLSIKLFSAPCLAKVDKGLIEHVIINLALNARDAVAQGGEITLETEILLPPEEFFSAHREHARRRMVCVKVRDTGCGMAPEELKHLFEPFYTTKELGKGTGLGLSMVYGTVKQSGGEVEVESAPGNGTVFKLYFPLIEAVPSGVQSQEEDKSFKGGTETVLLVDDEETLRKMGERLLKANGYKVISATDGKTALAAAELRGRPVDLLLTDVVMPGMSGRELALELARRKLAPRTLYMSGYTDEAILKHGVLEPGIAFIYKPFTVEALLSKLREVLDGPPGQARA
jgi:PAS domain S-box-containing protein